MGKKSGWMRVVDLTGTYFRFDSDWYLGSGGNNKILKLVLDGMKIQPCNPSFVDARDAILQADKINFNGDNECLIWKGFAKRGLGTKAKTGGHESFVFPSYCDEE
jgi:extracellular elastinolytic metalloproteinase